MNKLMGQTIDCIKNGTYFRTQDDKDYCLLYYPSRTREIFCPYLQRKDQSIRLDDHPLTGTLNYWTCLRQQGDHKLDQRIIKHLEGK